MLLPSQRNRAREERRLIMQTTHLTQCLFPALLAAGLLRPAPALAWSGYIVSFSTNSFTANKTSDVHVRVKNTGATVNFAVECKNIPSGWNVNDGEPLDLDNYRMQQVNAGATVDFGPFKVTPSSGGSAVLHWALHSEDWLSWTLLDEEYQFVSALGPPGFFNLTSPGANAVGQSPKPSFSWGSSSGASGYRFEIADFLPLFPRQIRLGNVTSWTCDQTLAYLGQYYWRVVATNAAGETEANGSWRRFTVVSPPTPVVQAVQPPVTITSVFFPASVRVSNPSPYAAEFDVRLEDLATPFPFPCNPWTVFATPRTNLLFQGYEVRTIQFTVQATSPGTHELRAQAVSSGRTNWSGAQRSVSIAYPCAHPIQVVPPSVLPPAPCVGEPVALSPTLRNTCALEVCVEVQTLIRSSLGGSQLLGQQPVCLAAGQSAVFALNVSLPAVGMNQVCLRTRLQGACWTEPWEETCFSLAAESCQPLRLTRPSLDGGVFRLTLTGAPGATCTVEASPNLENWTAVSTNQIPMSGTIQISGPSHVGLAAQFYRAYLR